MLYPNICRTISIRPKLGHSLQPGMMIIVGYCYTIVAAPHVDASSMFAQADQNLLRFGLK